MNSNNQCIKSWFLVYSDSIPSNMFFGWNICGSQQIKGIFPILSSPVSTLFLIFGIQNICNPYLFSLVLTLSIFAMDFKFNITILLWLSPPFIFYFTVFCLNLLLQRVNSLFINKFTDSWGLYMSCFWQYLRSQYIESDPIIYKFYGFAFLIFHVTVFYFQSFVDHKWQIFIWSLNLWF